tara:strand:+ start:140 stop:1192 length:1053 start_codon:yes stop_codon:yes gene_type:complete
MNWIKELIKILSITIILFLVLDFLVTWIYGARGFSKFYVHDNVEGRINKPNFNGKFGGILKPFNAKVNIGVNGERISFNETCDSKKNILFLGDSTTAGFEVNNNQTFISLINKKCSENKINGINFGVRAHDTHSIIGTYLRVKNDHPHNIIVYLMTDNDFEENLNPNAYLSMTKKFGRRYDGKIIDPVDDFSFQLYANLRMFVGDRLSLTTELISLIQGALRRSYSGERNDKKNNDKKKEILKANQLIGVLYRLAKETNVKLVVIPYPDLRDAQSIQIKRNENDLLLEKSIFKNFPEVHYININKYIEEKLLYDQKKVLDLRFKSDSHLSIYGHQVISYAVSKIIDNLKY